MFVTSTGYVEIPKLFTEYSTTFYICASANESHVERETFTEILPALRTCSNGFLLDNIPPHGGNVHVKNLNGYVNDLLYISWYGFDDNIDVKVLGYDQKIKSYTVEIGKNRYF